MSASTRPRTTVDAKATTAADTAIDAAREADRRARGRRRARLALAALTLVLVLARVDGLRGARWCARRPVRLRRRRRRRLPPGPLRLRRRSGVARLARGRNRIHVKEF